MSVVDKFLWRFLKYISVMLWSSENLKFGYEVMFPDLVERFLPVFVKYILPIVEKFIGHDLVIEQSEV